MLHITGCPMSQHCYFLPFFKIRLAGPLYSTTPIIHGISQHLPQLSMPHWKRIGILYFFLLSILPCPPTASSSGQRSCISYTVCMAWCVCLCVRDYSICLCLWRGAFIVCICVWMGVQCIYVCQRELTLYVCVRKGLQGMYVWKRCTVCVWQGVLQCTYLCSWGPQCICVCGGGATLYV